MKRETSRTMNLVKSSNKGFLNLCINSNLSLTANIETVIKHFLVILLLSFISCSTKSDLIVNQQKIENLKTFAKVYGYVRYFHPTDEASEIDWTAFSIYGAEQVGKCKSKKELVTTLKALFLPIAPTIKFTDDPTQSKYDLTNITPGDLKGYKPVYWQHFGVGMGMKSEFDTYHSVRVNGIIKKDYSHEVSKIMLSINASKYKGKKIKYTAWAKFGDSLSGNGYLRFLIQNSDGTSDLKREKVVGNQWRRYEIIADIDTLATKITIGSAFKGKGSMLFDMAELFYKRGDDWSPIPIRSNDFESGTLIKSEQPNQWYSEGIGYSSAIATTDGYLGGKSVVSSYMGITDKEKGKQIFEYAPEFGELIEKPIGNSINCQIPLVLYSNDLGTFPIPEQLQFSNLVRKLELAKKKPDNESVRLGNVINTYNVFQHFYPYMDVVDINWNQELEIALSRCFTDITAKEHLTTLQKFTAPLKDGHISVTNNEIRDYSTPPITWEWIEDKLVITHVLDSKTPLKIGDIVTQINGQAAKEYFMEINSKISAGTKGWLNHKAEQISLMGLRDSEMIITVNGNQIKLVRNSYPFVPRDRNPEYKKINDDVYYLNINSITMEAIHNLLPELEKTKSIICDLRRYPNRNHEFISYLLKENDTTTSWMQIPQNVYPDQDNLTGYYNSNWMLPSKKPYLGDKQIIFITKGSAISYAESYMGFIKGYGLAKIVGQPTAGTNGNINHFELSGGYGITWTGMKVLKHDGSQLHGIGFIPDTYVEPSIKGVMEGKDEFLEKAIELTERE